MAFAYTRNQILAESDRYLQNAAALPDSNAAKAQYIQAASNLANVVLARVYNEMAEKFAMIPPDDGSV